LADDYPTFGKKAMLSAHALHDFASKFPESGVEREFLVNRTYPTTNADMNIMWSAAMLSFVHGCASGPLCDAALSAKYKSEAEEIWTRPDVCSISKDSDCFCFDLVLKKHMHSWTRRLSQLVFDSLCLHRLGAM
jgi:hypothetical protein